jgi:antitoxin HigA-1
MAMHNPPHPGEFISEVYLEPNGISGRELAEKLDVSPSTLSRIIKGASRITPEWLFAFPRPSGARLRAGWSCRTLTIFGWPERASTSSA